MTDFGKELSWLDDVSPTHRFVEGTELIAQAIYRRLITPRGQLIDDPDYGLGIREFLHRAFTPAQEAGVPGQVRNEILKDERVVSAAVAFQRTGRAWTLSVKCETGAGPFELVLESGETLSSITAKIEGGT